MTDSCLCCRPAKKTPHKVWQTLARYMKDPMDKKSARAQRIELEVSVQQYPMFRWFAENAIDLREKPFNLWLTLPVRNLWSLEPGECIVAEELLSKLRDVEVFFPVHDVGVDLLVVRGEKHVGIQVKESRYYFSRTWKSGHVGHSWHQIRKEKLLRSKVDFYVFLTYLPAYAEHKLSYFQNRFLIAPRSELNERVRIKDAGKSGIFSFCFHFEDDHVWDERVIVSLENKLTDYGRFLEAWSLIEKAL